MREEFEKLPEIKLRLNEWIIFNGVEYTTHNMLFVTVVDCINLAWYTYQEQQKIIDHQNQRAINQAAHLYRVQEHNAKLQKRLKENGLIWQDLI